MEDSGDFNNSSYYENGNLSANDHDDSGHFND